MFLAENFGTKLHIVHASTKQAVQMLRNAKARGLRFTGETQPHYLLRVDTDLKDVGPLLKMNPPVRSKEHQDALWEGLLDGSIDMIATDHSPHTLEEKGCDINGKMTKSAIWDCISGFCGVETNVPLILTQVNKGRMTLNHYVKVQSENVAKVWQMYPKKGAIRLGSDGDLTIVDMNKEGTVDPKKLHSKNHPTPWGGWKVKGMPVYTVVRGNVQMKDGEPVGKVIGQMQTPIIN
jgi:dihydroorotase